jgi:hypothetical protein
MLSLPPFLYPYQSAPLGSSWQFRSLTTHTDNKPCAVLLAMDIVLALAISLWNLLIPNGRFFYLSFPPCPSGK